MVANARGNPAWIPGRSSNAGGRPKKLLRRVDEVVHAAGRCLVQEAIDLLPSLSPNSRIKALLELISYCQAKPKFHDDDRELVDQLKLLSTDELVKIVKEKIPQLKDVG